MIGGEDHFSCKEIDINTYEIKMRITLVPTICFCCSAIVDDANYKNLLAENFPQLFKTTKELQSYAVQQRLLEMYCGASTNIEYEYLCKPCLVKKILNTSFFSDSTTMIPCPFGQNTVDIDCCYPFLSCDETEKFRCRLLQHAEERNYFRYFCPVTVDGVDCLESTLYWKNNPGQNRVTRCLLHGNRCVKCWEEFQDICHSCSKYPKSVFTSDCDNLFRCPSCLVIIQRSEGCDLISCTCGHNFSGSLNAIHPTNSQIVPLSRPGPKLHWILPKTKKTPKARKMIIYDEEDKDYEDNVGEDLWLERKRSHPRSTY